MIASFLPLPPRPLFVMRERDQRDRSTGNLNMNENMAREFRPMDEARYESARWWRTLNRGMSVVGILVVAAVVSYDNRPPYHMFRQLYSATYDSKNLSMCLLVLQIVLIVLGVKQNWVS